MVKADLSKRLNEIQTEFDELDKQKATIVSQINGAKANLQKVETRQVQLQGAFNEVRALIAKCEEDEKAREDSAPNKNEEESSEDGRDKSTTTKPIPVQ